MNEFSIIKKFFDKHSLNDNEIVAGIGDDAALIAPPTGYELAFTTDTLVENIHFHANTDVYDIGYKSLAVNLSDLAAMGATPKWILLALTIPTNDVPWLEKFSAGIFDLAAKYSVKLIGGDLTRGPLTITIQAIGIVPTGLALRRSHAKPGDNIYVTGTLGDSAFSNYTLLPTPQVDTGIKLRGIASSAIDISDGLAADLQHILDASHVGAKVVVDHLPLSKELAHLDKQTAINFALNGGDDYQLCFTVPADKIHKLTMENITQIGVITADPHLSLIHQSGSKYHGTVHGFQHF